MSSTGLTRTIKIILTSTLGGDKWDIEPPVTVSVQALIAKFCKEPDLPFRPADDEGARVPYRLMWKEGQRILSESETLERAGVKEGDTLIMTQEARAGGPHANTGAVRPGMLARSPVGTRGTEVHGGILA